VDCTLCVQVCPTGIDIRKGLQYECIGCGACIDVCDDVMDKMGYARGLIKYSTQNGVEQGWTRNQMLRRALRPRVLVYVGVLGLIALAWAASLALRTPLKVDVIRDRATLARMVEQGRIENVYRLQVMNATEETQRLSIAVEGLPGLDIAADNSRQMEVLPTEVNSLVVRVQMPPQAAQSGSHPIYFVLQTEGRSAMTVREKAVFLVPR
jgi:cytochrome c oxidase accessory protein FixG